MTHPKNIQPVVLFLLLILLGSMASSTADYNLTALSKQPFQFTPSTKPNFNDLYFFKDSSRDLRTLVNSFPNHKEFNNMAEDYRNILRVININCSTIPHRLTVEYANLIQEIEYFEKSFQEIREPSELIKEALSKALNKFSATDNAAKNNCQDVLLQMMTNISLVRRLYEIDTVEGRYLDLQMVKDEILQKMLSKLQTVSQSQSDLEAMMMQNQTAQLRLSTIGDQITSIQDQFKAAHKRKLEILLKDGQANDRKMDKERLIREDEEKRYIAQIKHLHEVYLTRTNEITEEQMRLSMQIGKDLVYPVNHIIILWDRSFSMMGSLWTESQKAVKRFIDDNKDQDLSLLSIILFSNEATEHMKKQRLDEYFAPEFKDALGTNYKAAFEMAANVIRQSRLRPIVLFLTDGFPNINNYETILQHLNSEFRYQGLMMFGIGIGDAYNSETLRNVVRTGNGGSDFIKIGDENYNLLHDTKDETVLTKIFTNISHTLRSVDKAIKFRIKELNETKERLFEEHERETSRLTEHYNRAVRDQIQPSLELASREEAMHNEELNRLENNLQKLNETLIKLLAEKSSVYNVTLQEKIIETRNWLKIEGDELAALKISREEIKQHMQEMSNNTSLQVLSNMNSIKDRVDEQINKNIQMLQVMMVSMAGHVEYAKQLITIYNSTERPGSDRQEFLYQSLVEIYGDETIHDNSRDARNQGLFKIAKKTLGYDGDNKDQLKLIGIVSKLVLEDISNADHQTKRADEEIRGRLLARIGKIDLSTLKEEIDRKGQEILELEDEFELKQQELEDLIQRVQDCDWFDSLLYLVQDYLIPWWSPSVVLKKEIDFILSKIERLKKTRESKYARYKLIVSETKEEYVTQALVYFTDLKSEWKSRLDYHDIQKIKEGVKHRAHDFYSTDL